MASLQEFREEVEAVSRQNGVDPSVVLSLLALEERHQNLHGYGARGRLRRDMAAIVEEALRDSTNPA